VINVDFKENSNQYAPPRDAEALRQLTLSARADKVLHERALARLEAQLQAIGVYRSSVQPLHDEL
jgi:hypothetical protein